MTTKQDLLREAYRLGAEGVDTDSTVPQLRAAIKKAAERGTVRYEARDIPVCWCGRPRNHVHAGERERFGLSMGGPRAVDTIGG